MRDSDRAHNSLKRKIIEQSLPPGSPINETTLTHDLKVGRTPVREALIRLDNEGLVNIIPHRGIFVAPIDITTLQKIYEVRLVLEPLCGQLAAERIQEKELTRLHKILDRMNELTEEGSLFDVIQVDRKFHNVIARASQNEYLQSSLYMLYDHSLRLWSLTYANATPVRETCLEHEQILDALESKCPKDARNALKRHVVQFRKRLRNLL